MAYYARISDNQMQVLIESQNQLRSQREVLVGQQLLEFIYFDLKKLNEALDHAYSFAAHVRNPDFEGILGRLDMQNIYLRFFVELLLDTIINHKPNTKTGFETLRNQYPQEVTFLMQNEKFKKRLISHSVQALSDRCFFRSRPRHASLYETTA